MAVHCDHVRVVIHSSGSLSSFWHCFCIHPCHVCPSCVPYAAVCHIGSSPAWVQAPAHTCPTLDRFVLFVRSQLCPVLRSCLLQVPFRRVHLTNGNHFDLYDTSGPQVGFNKVLRRCIGGLSIRNRILATTSICMTPVDLRRVSRTFSISN